MADNYLSEILSDLQTRMREQDRINREIKHSIDVNSRDIISCTNRVCPQNSDAIVAIVKNELGLPTTSVLINRLISSILIKNKEVLWKTLLKYIGAITAIATMVIALIKVFQALGIKIITQ